MPRNLETNLGIANFLQTVEFFELGLDYDVRVPDLLRQRSRARTCTRRRAARSTRHVPWCVAGPYAGQPR